MCKYNNGFYFILILLIFELCSTSGTLVRPEPFSLSSQRGVQVDFGGGLPASGTVPAGQTSVSATRHFVAAANNVIVPALISPSQHHRSGLLSQHATGFTISPNAVSPTVNNNVSGLERLASAVHANPVLAAFLITSLLNANRQLKPVAYNTPEHLPPDPYVALLLSHYGRYIARPGVFGHGLYGYSASNNIHNTKPFGSYKIVDDSR